MIRIAINGYGRIGRCVLRALHESEHQSAMQIVAINEPADLSTIAHLTQYDSTHGRLNADVQRLDNGLSVASHPIQVTHHKSLSDISWQGLDIDVVFECSGQWCAPEQLKQHINAGAKRVLLSQPGNSDVNAIVFGVNHNNLNAQDVMASSASCTTNAIVPVIDALHKAFGVVNGTLTTIHSMMNDQPVVDGYHHTDLRKTRSAVQSMIPIETGLAVGVGRILPELNGRFTARAVRIPVANVSAIEMTVQLNKPATAEHINAVLSASAKTDYFNTLGYTEEPLASCDYNHDPRSGVIDAGQTRVAGNLATVLVWFDNEWGYANRMLDVNQYWHSGE